MSNYPPGADHDPNAPYNQPEEEYIICQNCNGSGYDGGFVCPFCGEDLTKSDYPCIYYTEKKCPKCKSKLDFEFCSICDGEGEVPRTFEDDLADEETAAEEKGDRIRNESHF